MKKFKSLKESMEVLEKDSARVIISGELIRYDELIRVFLNKRCTKKGKIIKKRYGLFAVECFYSLGGDILLDLNRVTKTGKISKNQNTKITTTWREVLLMYSRR